MASRSFGSYGGYGARRPAARRTMARRPMARRAAPRRTFTHRRPGATSRMTSTHMKNTYQSDRNFVRMKYTEPSYTATLTGGPVVPWIWL